MINEKFKNRFRDSVVTIKAIGSNTINYDTDTPQKMYNQFYEEEGDAISNFTMPAETFNKIYKKI